MVVQRLPYRTFYGSPARYRCLPVGCFELAVMGGDVCRYRAKDFNDALTAFPAPVIQVVGPGFVDPIRIHCKARAGRQRVSTSNN